jgi:hypothetical protein
VLPSSQPSSPAITPSPQTGAAPPVPPVPLELVLLEVELVLVLVLVLLLDVLEVLPELLDEVVAPPEPVLPPVPIVSPPPPQATSAAPITSPETLRAMRTILPPGPSYSRAGAPWVRPPQPRRQPWCTIAPGRERNAAGNIRVAAVSTLP